MAAVLSHSRMSFFDSVAELGWKVFRRSTGGRSQQSGHLVVVTDEQDLRLKWRAVIQGFPCLSA